LNTFKPFRVFMAVADKDLISAHLIALNATPLLSILKLWW
jgi:hypothetical protein